MEPLGRAGWAWLLGIAAAAVALAKIAGDPPLFEAVPSPSSSGATKQRSWWSRMSDKKVFVSYDYDNDKNYKNLLAAWDANAEFDFTWEDHSTPKINSTDADYIKGVIADKMKKADCLLVIVGKETHKSDWVDWEIKKAKDLGLALVGVKIDKSYTSPAALLNCGASWALSFTQDAVVAALESC